MKSWSAHETGERRKKGVTFGMMGFLLQSKHHMSWSCIFLRWLNTYLPAHGNELLVFFCLCECLLLYLLNCLYLKIRVLSLFSLLFSPTGVGVSGCIVLGYWLGLDHDPLRPALQPPLAKPCHSCPLQQYSFTVYL